MSFLKANLKTKGDLCINRGDARFLQGIKSPL